MGGHWFRFYDDVIHDVKVQALPAPMFKSWVNVLCIVSNNGGYLPALNAVAWALRVDEAAAFETITALRKAGLLDAGEGGALVPHNWEGRQFITDQADGSGTPAAVRARNERSSERTEHVRERYGVTTRHRHRHRYRYRYRRRQREESVARRRARWLAGGLPGSVLDEVPEQGR